MDMPMDFRVWCSAGTLPNRHAQAGQLRPVNMPHPIW